MVSVEDCHGVLKDTSFALLYILRYPVNTMIESSGAVQGAQKNEINTCLPA